MNSWADQVSDREEVDPVKILNVAIIKFIHCIALEKSLKMPENIRFSL